jgi:hypothetical protein
VVTHVPASLESAEERRITERVRAFLCDPAADLPGALDLPEPLVLHVEPELFLDEALRIGGGKSPDESPLLRDYLKLFLRVFPSVAEPRLSTDVQRIVAEAMDDPDGTEERLEALARAFPHPITYRALLQFYRLRRIEPDKMLPSAYRYWDLSRRDGDILLWQVVSAYASQAAGALAPRWAPELIEAVWSAHGGVDESLGRKLAAIHVSAGQLDRALDVLSRLTRGHDASEEVVLEHFRLLKRVGKSSDAGELLQRFTPVLGGSPAFQAATGARASLTMGPQAGPDPGAPEGSG